MKELSNGTEQTKKQTGAGAKTDMRKRQTRGALSRLMREAMSQFNDGINQRMFATSSLIKPEMHEAITAMNAWEGTRV